MSKLDNDSLTRQKDLMIICRYTILKFDHRQLRAFVWFHGDLGELHWKILQGLGFLKYKQCGGKSNFHTHIKILH